MNRALETEPAATTAAAAPSVLAMIGLLAGPLLTMVDSSVVNVAVPDISRSVHTDLATVQWTVSAYLLALAAMLAASAWLTRRYGSRAVYVTCLGAFTVTSALCALSPNIQFLIAARVLQGLAGAPLVPIALSMLMGGTENASRGMQSGGAAAGAATALLFLAPALGPTLGGTLIGVFGWPSIFLINVPFGLLGVAGALSISAKLNLPADRSARLDPLGLALLALGTGFALYGAGQGAAHGWTDVTVWPFWATGLVLVAAYAGWAWRHSEPALNLRVLRDRLGAVSMALATLVSVISFSALFLVPVVMQTIQGFSAFQAGLAMLPQGLMMGVGAFLGGLVTRSGRVRASAAIGGVILVITTLAMLLIDLGTPGWETALILCGRAVAFGLIVQPLLTAMLGSIPRDESADASTLFNVIQRLGGSFGVGLLGSVFGARVAARIGDAMRGLGIPAPASAGSLRGSLATALGSVPQPVRNGIETALIAAFHDVVWALVGVSALCILIALLLPGQRRLIGDESLAS